MLLGIEFHTKKSAGLKFKNVQKQEIRFTLGLSDAKNTLYVKKRLK